MKLEELYAQIKEDFPIDSGDLLGETTKTQQLWVKYIQLYSSEKLRLEKMYSSRATLISRLREYYSGNALPEVYKQKPYNGIIPKTENGLMKLVENDQELINYDDATLVQKQKVYVLEESVKECKQRGYSIANAISYTKFLNGG